MFENYGFAFMLNPCKESYYFLVKRVCLWEHLPDLQAVHKVRRMQVSTRFSWYSQHGLVTGQFYWLSHFVNQKNGIVVK